MRRFQPPFNGKRFLLNTNTGEIRDLENETDYCHINDIKPDHICMGDSYMSCLIAAQIRRSPKANGCFYCLNEKDNG